MRQVTLHSGDQIVQVQETYKPKSLQDFLHTTGGRASIHQAAAEMAGFGDVDIFLSGNRQDEHTYTVEFILDMSRNRQAARNLGIATLGARIQRFFGYEPEMAPAVSAAQGSGYVATDAPGPGDDGPPATALGDFYRAIGHALGLLADHAVAAMVGAWAGIKGWLR